jgi:hypothetical protein
MNPFRPAIAMIELIFAIVIMGIAMMSAPMLISSASKSTYVALQQEGINEAASRINMIMGYAWDENNTDDRYTPPILHVTSGNGDLNMTDIITARRIGTPLLSQRTFIRSDANNSNLNASSTLGSDGGDIDDIDDFIGDISLTEIEAASVDYVEQTTININTAIAYISDSPDGGTYTAQTITFVPFTASGGTTNIKSITVTLTSTTSLDELEKTIILRAFSCNIGGYELKERLF